MIPSTRNFAKPFSIAGLIVGEIYMLFTVLGPNTAGVVAPLGAMVARVAGAALFFGPFGAVVGMGVGLLVSGLVNLLRR